MIYDTMMCVLRDIYTAKQQLKPEHRDRKRTNTLKKLKHKNDFYKKTVHLRSRDHLCR